MKNFKLFKLLALFVVLITSIPQVKAWDIWANLYFNNTDKAWEYVSFIVGRDDHSTAYKTAHLSNTNLYYVWVDYSGYNDLYFFNADWDGTNNEKPYKRVSYLGSDNRWQPGKFDYNKKVDNNAIRYYFDGETTASAIENLPLKTATVKVKKSTNGGAYALITEGSWPATINLQGTYMDGNAATAQSNFDTSSGDKAEYGSIPVTGEATMTLGDFADDSYEFKGWGLSTVPTIETTTYTYNVDDNTTYYAFFKTKEYTITYNGGANSESGSHTPDTKYHGVSKALPTATFTRTGYTHTGWATSDGGAQVYALGASYTANAAVTLFPVWTPVALTSAAAGNWNSKDTWSPACVPTKDHDVTIAHAVSVSDARVAKSVSINQSTGSLTIASTGTLDVIGSISNASEERLEVMAGGALIFNYTSAPAAKVHLSVTGGTFRYIALPISYVHVSSAFPGSGVYTYVWNEGTGWERRGYYDDISGNEPIAISGQSSWTFSGTLVNALFGSVAYTSGKTYAGTNMYANSWTAPIRISGVTISGNADEVVYTDNSGSWTANTAGDPGDAVIPAMSAFVILANGAGGGSVSIPYNTAVRNVAVSPSSAPKRVASNDMRNHITMNVTGNELKTNLRLYENEQFTNEFDNGWEARYIEGDGRSGQLYAQTDDKMVVLTTPDLEGQVVGFIPGEATDYTISFEGDGKGYYLNDMDLEQSTLIAEGNTYEFTPNESTNATRFVISKIPIHRTPTGIEDVTDSAKARKQMIDGVLYIIRNGRIYNAEGTLVK